MPVYRLDDRLIFPPPEHAEREGLLAVGGDLRPERLLLAYSMGIFPWYEEGLPILWHSPDPRMVLLAPDLHVGRSLRKAIRRGDYELIADERFEEIVSRCAATARPGQDGTWITSDMKNAYLELHRLGFAHCVGAYRGGDLVGGLYGVSIGGAFFGESMFSAAPDASKVAFVQLVAAMASWGIELIDCQVQTSHLARFGARPWPRPLFLEALEVALEAPTRRGRWTLELS